MCHTHCAMKKKKVTINIKKNMHTYNNFKLYFFSTKNFQKKICVVSFLPSEYEKQKKLTYVLLQLFETLLKVFLCHYSKDESLLKTMKRIPKNEKSPV